MPFCMACSKKKKIKNTPLINKSLKGHEPLKYADFLTNADSNKVYILNNYIATVLSKNKFKFNKDCECKDTWVKISECNFTTVSNIGVIYQHPKGILISFCLLSMINYIN